MALGRIKASGQSGPETDAQQLAAANAGFGFRLLKELARQEPHANLFLSPYSISSVLQMLSTGSAGSTRQELLQALRLDHLSSTNLNAAYAALSRSLDLARTNVDLNIANALWYRAGAELSPGFAAENERFYSATLGALDFSNPRSVQIMNEWAAQNTHGKIPAIIQPPIPSDTAMILANAIYFKGTWLNQFDAKLTKPRPFHLLTGEEKAVPMMGQTRSFEYQHENGFQAVQLPYAGNRLLMQVLLPDPDSDLPALLQRLDYAFWSGTILPGFTENRGTLIFPRFELRYAADLKQSLAALGVQSAMSPEADFSGISSSRLYLSQIKHESFVQVNEQGTEAAAVTTGVVALASVRNHPPPFQMVVDRPFLFLIEDRQTRSLLFIGAVLAPDSAG